MGRLDVLGPKEYRKIVARYLEILVIKHVENVLVAALSNERTLHFVMNAALRFTFSSFQSLFRVEIEFFQ